jgi:hypothetical protein
MDVGASILQPSDLGAFETARIEQRFGETVELEPVMRQRLLG